MRKNSLNIFLPHNNVNRRILQCKWPVHHRTKITSFAAQTTTKKENQVSSAPTPFFQNKKDKGMMEF